MFARTTTVGLTLLALGAGPATKMAHWPQFRGPGAAASADGGRLPAEFGPDKNLVWKTALPPGHSSPCIWGDHIFLTALDEGKLETICIRRTDGRVLWRKATPQVEIAEVHPGRGSSAASTPTTDGQRVYVYFGSFGLVCYDFDGNEQWKRPLDPPNNFFGAATSPVRAGDLLILNCDQDVASYVLALNPATGETVWKKPRDGFPKGYTTPFLWEHDSVQELIVPGTLRAKAYDLRDGYERWSVDGLARIVCTSPAAGDGLLFLATWAPGAEAADRIKVDSFDDYIATHDKNNDRKITLDEVTEDAIQRRFRHFDANKDGVVLEAEWTAMAAVFSKARNALLAIRPGGQGDVTKTHVVWEHTRALPYVASPLYYKGRLYTVKDGGIVSAFHAKTGRQLFSGRLGVQGEYYASLVAGDDKVYAAAMTGTVVVLAAGDKLEVVARNDLAETIMATPAIVDGTLYIRTARHLYAFARGAGNARR